MSHLCGTRQTEAIQKVLEPPADTDHCRLRRDNVISRERCVAQTAATLITDADVRCHGDLPAVPVGVWTFPVNGSAFKGLARSTTNKEI